MRICYERECHERVYYERMCNERGCEPYLIPMAPTHPELEVSSIQHLYSDTKKVGQVTRRMRIKTDYYGTSTPGIIGDIIIYPTLLSIT